ADRRNSACPQVRLEADRVPCARSPRGSVRSSQKLGMSLPFDRPPSDLCIIRLSAIGDTCHTVPVVRAIHAAWPASRLTWIIGRTEHSLLRGLEGVEFLILDKSRGLKGYADVRRAL